MTGERRPGPARGKRSNGGTLALWDALPSVSVGKFAGDTWKDMTDDWIPAALATGHVEKIQAQIDDLTEKAKKKRAFSADDKEFLTDLYGWIAWGGGRKGLGEASKLLAHYLNGNGKSLEIDSEVYQSSVIVRYAVGEIKSAIAGDVRKAGVIRNNGNVASRDILKKKSFGDVGTKGQILDNGILLAEQNNVRLKNANNRFGLTSISKVADNEFWESDAVRIVETRWRVDDSWDFASFGQQRKEKRNDFTVLPLRGGKSLRLPDGLSHYLTQLGLAMEFEHYSEWAERWELPEEKK